MILRRKRPVVQHTKIPRVLCLPTAEGSQVTIFIGRQLTVELTDRDSFSSRLFQADLDEHFVRTHLL